MVSTRLPPPPLFFPLEWDTELHVSLLLFLHFEWEGRGGAQRKANTSRKGGGGPRFCSDAQFFRAMRRKRRRKVLSIDSRRMCKGTYGMSGVKVIPSCRNNWESHHARADSSEPEVGVGEEEFAAAFVLRSYFQFFLPFRL